MPVAHERRATGPRQRERTDTAIAQYRGPRIYAGRTELSDVTSASRRRCRQPCEPARCTQQHVQDSRSPAARRSLLSQCQRKRRAPERRDVLRTALHPRFQVLCLMVLERALSCHGRSFVGPMETFLAKTHSTGRRASCTVDAMPLPICPTSQRHDAGVLETEAFRQDGTAQLPLFPNARGPEPSFMPTFRVACALVQGQGESRRSARAHGEILQTRAGALSACAYRRGSA